MRLVDRKMNKYEIRIRVKAINGSCVAHKVGDEIIYRNDQLYSGEHGICMGALGAMMPTLAALARETVPTEHDWLKSPITQVCPDQGTVTFELTRREIK